MASRIWSRQDLRNILLSVYAAHVPLLEEAAGPDTTAGPALYRWGCRAAVQSLLLALGLPLQALDQAGQQPAPAAAGDGTEHWWLEDLERIIAAVHRSAVSTPVSDAEAPSREPYLQGFGEVVAAVLQAIGSEQDPHQWLRQTLADRYWVFCSDQNASLRLIGSQWPPDTVPSGEA